MPPNAWASSAHRKALWSLLRFLSLPEGGALLLICVSAGEAEGGGVAEGAAPSTVESALRSHLPPCWLPPSLLLVRPLSHQLQLLPPHLRHPHEQVWVSSATDFMHQRPLLSI